VKEIPFDGRRHLFIPGNKEATIEFAASHFIKCAGEAIADHGFFAVALSGGSTPKLIYKLLSSKYRDAISWDKVLLFWSDERAVSPEDSESNAHMALEEGGLKELSIPKENIFRMEGEKKDLEQVSHAYEKVIREQLKNASFDLMMLGMGDDGHTASLFPHTEALHMVGKLVAPNFVPQKKTWRLTLTFECINRAKHIVLYVLGSGKAEMVERVLKSPYSPDDLPSQRVGTLSHPATYILDEDAGERLLST
jgi:6-phosphogluconolactonase